MCFSAPETPRVPPEDPELKAQREAADQAAQKSLRDDKEKALNLEVARLSGAYGPRSLISGEPGGRGYGSSLLS